MNPRTVKVIQQTLTLATDEHVQLVDVTAKIRDVVLAADIADGVLLVNSLHTTSALLVGEFGGPLAEDLKAALERLAAEHAGYKHDDSRYSDCERGNASSHLRAALLGRSLALGIKHGEVTLGPAQSIVFAELDGPRPRAIDVQMLGG
jgi:secondary thiamine-phosphate synthase enzyme